MTADRTLRRWPRILAAAARLAGMYVTVLLLLIVPFMFFPADGLPSIADVAKLVSWAIVPFALTFILLAAARRAGFVVFWMLLAAVWVAFLMARGLPIDLLIAFVAWSVLALPLHLLTALGIPGAPRLRIPGAYLTVSALTTILWTLLLIPAVAVLYLSSRLMYPEPHALFLLASRVAAFVWGPAPLVLAALSIAHAWPRTLRRPRGASLAAGMLTSLAVSLDVAVHLTAAPVGRPAEPPIIVVRQTAPLSGMRIMRPDVSTLDPMPCLEAHHADSSHHAGLPGLAHSPCEVASTHARGTRSLGMW